MATLDLQPQDARLVYLAIVYHLGRPGSETDAATIQRHDLGLGPVREPLEGQLEQARATLDLSPYQLARLGEALHGTVNELKQHELSGGRSVVPGFAEALHRLFPETADGGVGALDVARDAVMLRRRLDAAVKEAEAQVAAAREGAAQAERVKRPWWKVWQR